MAYSTAVISLYKNRIYILHVYNVEGQLTGSPCPALEAVVSRLFGMLLSGTLPLGAIVRGVPPVNMSVAAPTM